jgi:hypothetical protein
MRRVIRFGLPLTALLLAPLASLAAEPARPNIRVRSLLAGWMRHHSPGFKSLTGVSLIGSIARAGAPPSPH